MTDLLQQGIAAAKAGQRGEARKLLMRLLESDQRSELGWLWLSGVVEDPEDIRTCLHNVLEINPSNLRAKQGLAWVEQRYGPAAPRPAPSMHTATQPRAASLPAQEATRPTPPTQAVPTPNGPGASGSPAHSTTTARTEIAPDAADAPPPAPRAASRPPTVTERSVGTAFTRTTTNLGPVPPPDTSAAPPPAAPAAPRKAPPAPPTQRFTPPKPEPVESGHDALNPTQAAERPPIQPPLQPDPTRPVPAQTTLYEPVVPAALTAPAENPCPYCGAPTASAQKHCTQCRSDLLVRAAPPEKRSTALTILGVLWGLGGALALLLAALLVGLLLIGRPAASTGAASNASDQTLTSVAVALMVGLVYVAVSRGLLARQRWAFYVNITLIALSLLATLAGAVVGAALVGFLMPNPGRAPNGGIAGLIAPLLAGAAFVLLPIVLTSLSYHDFFGPLVRFIPTFEDADHVGHYNNGIAYKNRGMWFMAAQEWEAAARKKPRSATYLHALGLAYAQLKRFEQARAALDSALRAAPEDAKIKESLALVDTMAARAAK